MNALKSVARTQRVNNLALQGLMKKFSVIWITSLPGKLKVHGSIIEGWYYNAVFFVNDLQSRLKVYRIFEAYS